MVHIYFLTTIAMCLSSVLAVPMPAIIETDALQIRYADPEPRALESSLLYPRNQSIAQRVRAYRQSRGLTQAALAAMVGITVATVQLIESGRGGVAALAAVCRALGIC